MKIGRRFLLWICLLPGAAMAVDYEIQILTEQATVPQMQAWLQDFPANLDWQREQNSFTTHTDKLETALELVHDLIMQLGSSSEHFPASRVVSAGRVDLLPLYDLIQREQLKLDLKVQRIEVDPVGIKFRKQLLIENNLAQWFHTPQARQGRVSVSAIAQLARAQMLQADHLHELEKYGQLDQWLWQLWNSENRSHLTLTLTALRRHYPYYVPPKELMQLRGTAPETPLERMIQQAIVSGDDAQLFSLYADHPEAFSCKNIQALWGLAQSMARVKGADRAFPLYLHIIVSCPDSRHRIDTLYKAKALLDFDHLWSLVAQEAGHSRGALQQKRYQQFVNELRREALTQALADGQSAAFDHIRALSASVMHERDVTTATYFGWIYFNIQALGHAEVWFLRALSWQPQQASAAEGYLLVLLKRGQFEQALAWIQPRAAWLSHAGELIRDIYLRQAWQALNQGQYTLVGQLLAECPSCELEGIEEQHLVAMERFLSGGDSLPLFAKLYAAAPNEAIAQSYAAALESAAQWALLKQLAEQHQGPFRLAYQRHLAAQAYAKNTFLLKNRWDDLYPVDTRGYAGPWMLAGLAGRIRQGDRELDNFSVYRVPHLEARMVQGQHELKFWADWVHAKTDTPDTQSPYGHYLNTAPIAGAENEIDGGYSPSFSWSFEDSQQWQIYLSRTPRGGALSAQWIADVSWQADWEKIDASVGISVFQDAVRDSLLSYFGMTDIYTGLSWGQVSRRGVKLDSHREWAGDTVSAQLVLEQLSGTSVRRNEHWQLSLSHAHDLSREGDHYRVWGPLLQMEQYSENLNYFSWGHGGYYSPQSRVALGVFGDWLSQQGRPWLAHLKGEAGLAYSEQEPAACYALNVKVVASNRCQFTYPGETDLGPFASLEGHGVRVLSSHWHLGAGARYGVSEEWQEFSYHLFVRFLFEPRGSSFRPDLDETSFNRL